MATAIDRTYTRAAKRDEVHYRTRAFGPDARTLSLLVVNLSAMGLMARCDTELQAGERLHVNLPVVGAVAAEVRWALGGRIGCELDRPIDQASYFELLAAMMRAG